VVVPPAPPLAPRCERSSDDPAQSLQHPLMPESRIGAKIPALAYYAASVAHVLDPQ